MDPQLQCWKVFVVLEALPVNPKRDGDQDIVKYQGVLKHF